MRTDTPSQMRKRAAAMGGARTRPATMAQHAASLLAALPVLALVAVLLAAAVPANADGMIVPVRPDLRVRGAWSVNYHHVNVTVRDQVASVVIDQEFVNNGSGMIEVEYLFPVPPEAAIDSMTLVVNGKEFAAKLLKAEEARRIYEDIVRRKKDPALLEYVGFGLYRTKAFPLEPGKPAKVLVTYKNVCGKDGDLVKVWYPLNTEKFSAKPIDSVRVKVDVKSKADITAVYSPTHDLNVDRRGPRQIVATYEAKNTLPTTDFQVFYKAADESVGATLLSHQPDPDKDGYFLLLVSPNPRDASGAVVAKDVVVVMDHSGSMSGEKLDQAKQAVRFILEHLNAKDRFNVVAYSDRIETFFDGLVRPDKARRTEAQQRLDRIDPTGGTNIHEALTTAMKMFGRKSRRPGYILFLTDGQPTVGKIEESEILPAVAKANAAGVRLFSLGVGYDVNVRLLDKLVRDNQGRSDYVKPSEPADTKLASLYNKIKNPVMTDLKVSVKGVKLLDMYPRQVGDLFDGEQLVLVGRYAGVGKLPKAEGVHHTTLLIRGLYQGEQRTFEYPVTLQPGGRDARFTFVEKLWAVRRVGYLLDQIQLNGKKQELIDELVRLSRDYGIMTPYTSFLADETTSLASAAALRGMAGEALGELATVDGRTGQRHAKNRAKMNHAQRAPAASGLAPAGGPGKTALDAGVAQWGHSDDDAYEEGKQERVQNVRNAGSKSLYRRGRVWVASNAGDLDARRDQEKIQVVERYSKEYFELVRQNKVEENQLLATQRKDEEILIRLRGQAYLIR